MSSRSHTEENVPDDLQEVWARNVRLLYSNGVGVQMAYRALTDPNSAAPSEDLTDGAGGAATWDELAWLTSDFLAETMFDFDQDHGLDAHKQFDQALMDVKWGFARAHVEAAGKFDGIVELCIRLAARFDGTSRRGALVGALLIQSAIEAIRLKPTEHALLMSFVREARMRKPSPGA